MAAGFDLFARFGVELEYMLVRRDTLDVLPVSDQVLHAVAGAFETEVAAGPLHWSNELVLHVLELKTGAPAATLEGLAPLFAHDLRRINHLLEPLGGLLMPGGMHPWMDPATQARLWPHEYNAVYQTFDRIFNCRGHGWSNLQATHLNLPFADDAQFARLHAAIRLLLPILPALAASSPFCEGRATGLLDTRLETYRHNCARVPSVTGRVIPEPVFSRSAYQREVLERIYRDIAPFDPTGVVQFEWCNARGAIARFDRNTIEIRLLDVQECPAADLAILRLVSEALRELVEERWNPLEAQQGWPVDRLEPILTACIRDADEALITDRDYLAALGVLEPHRCTAREVWAWLFESAIPEEAHAAAEFAPLRTILEQGCLARRLLAAAGPAPSTTRLHDVYRELTCCAATNEMFVP